ncbi:hypothetical protein RSAG8_11209, partial [Rhizoctonia solani AG-8 WAC10335]
MALTRGDGRSPAKHDSSKLHILRTTFNVAFDSLTRTLHQLYNLLARRKSGQSMCLRLFTPVMKTSHFSDPHFASPARIDGCKIRMSEPGPDQLVLSLAIRRGRGSPGPSTCVGCADTRS